jgi:hypothetical protein
LGLSQIQAHWLPPLFQCTTRDVCSIASTSNIYQYGTSYEYITSALFAHTVHPYISHHERLTLFFYNQALCYFFGDLLCLGKVRLGREVSGTSALSQKKAFENASRWGVPSFAFWGDLVITFLTLAAACAVAGLRGGLSDLDANYCDGVGKDWCHKMATAAAFGMCTFVLFLPSVALNTANAVGPW